MTTPSIQQQYADFVRSRAKSMGSIEADLHHMATGCATEAGEFLSTTKKLWVYGQTLDTLNKEGVNNQANIAEELGDLLFYVQGACNLLGYTMQELMMWNMEKLVKRYPEGYSDAAALARADKIVPIAPSGEVPLQPLVGKFGE